MGARLSRPCTFDDLPALLSAPVNVADLPATVDWFSILLDTLEAALPPFQAAVDGLDAIARDGGDGSLLANMYKADLLCDFGPFPPIVTVIRRRVPMEIAAARRAAGRGELLGAYAATYERLWARAQPTLRGMDAVRARLASAPGAAMRALHACRQGRQGSARVDIDPAVAARAVDVMRAYCDASNAAADAAARAREGPQLPAYAPPLPPRTGIDVPEGGVVVNHYQRGGGGPATPGAAGGVGAGGPGGGSAPARPGAATSPNTRTMPPPPPRRGDPPTRSPTSPLGPHLPPPGRGAPTSPNSRNRSTNTEASADADEARRAAVENFLRNLRPGDILVLDRPIEELAVEPEPEPEPEWEDGRAPPRLPNRPAAGPPPRLPARQGSMPSPRHGDGGGPPALPVRRASAAPAPPLPLRVEREPLSPTAAPPLPPRIPNGSESNVGGPPTQPPPLPASRPPPPLKPKPTASSAGGGDTASSPTEMPARFADMSLGESPTSPPPSGGVSPTASRARPPPPPRPKPEHLRGSSLDQAKGPPPVPPRP